jgi:hypothetical protein
MSGRDINYIILDTSEHIGELISTTEELYGAIFAELPSIESEIELTAKEVEILLDFFIHQNEQQNERQNEQSLTNNHETTQQLSRILREVENEVRATTANMVDEAEIRKIIESFLQSSKTAGEISFDDVMEVIYKVKERIMDIELVSMNAIIFSGKLGEDGKAFGVISDHIMAFSNKVDEQYRTMEQYAEGLGYWNQQFVGNLDIILEYHRKLREEQLQEFVEIFDNVFASLETVRGVLGEVNSSVHMAVKPVQELMIKIQVQDILRQGLENVQKCLITIMDNKRNADADNSTAEATMNILAINKSLMQLVIDLVMNIKDKLTKSLTDIETPVNDMRSQLMNLVEDEQTLAEYFGGDEYKTNVISEIFTNVKVFLRHFDNELVELRDKMNGFSEINESFNIQISQIEKRIRKIKRLVGHLQKLNILSRIELSRINLDGSAFVSQIQSIADQVTKEVNKNEEYVVRLKERLEHDLDQFQKVLKINVGKANEMRLVIKGAIERLDIIEQLITDAIQPIGTSSNSLYNEIMLISNKLELGTDIYSLLELIEGKLFEIYDYMDDELRKHMEATGIEEWNNSNEHLQEILNYFTTHSERVIAQLHLEGEQLDVGTDGGELTLF